MNKDISKTIAEQAWFKGWFDSRFYHHLYANRDEQEARDFIDSLLKWLKPSPVARMLDLGCGRGRHSKHLASQGFDVTGIDLAASSIEVAKMQPQDNLRFYRQDMRLPFGERTFDFVFSFFTSFGYFDSTHDDNLVIENIASSLCAGGSIVIDYINSPYAEKRLKKNEVVDMDGIIYQIDRWTSDSHFYKKITIRESLFGDPLSYTEKIKKFTVEDFGELFSAHGLTLKKVFGNYRLDSYDLQSSPRMILIGEKQSR